MNQTNKYSMMKASNSFQTNTTFEETTESGITIHVIKPLKRSQNLTDNDDITLEQNRGNDKVLASLGEQNAQTFVNDDKTSKNGSQLSTKNQPNQKQTVFLLEQNKYKNYVSQTNAQPTLNNLPKEKQKPYQNQNAPQSQILKDKFKEEKCLKNQNDSIQTTKKLQEKVEKTDNILIDISQEGSMRDAKQSDIIDLDEASRSTKKYQSARPSFTQNIVINRFSRAAPVAQTERASHESRSNSKLKLKDYLYMVEATSRRQKDDLRNSRTSKQASQTKINHPPILQNLPKEAFHPIPEKLFPLTPKKEAALLRYSVPNSKMYDILKKQIHEDIISAEKNMEKIDSELEGLQIQGQQEPSNEQLLILYNIRRQIKEEVNKKLQSALQLLRDHKKGLNSDFPKQVLTRKTTSSVYRKQQ